MLPHEKRAPTVSIHERAMQAFLRRISSSAFFPLRDVTGDGFPGGLSISPFITHVLGPLFPKFEIKMNTAFL